MLSRALNRLTDRFVPPSLRADAEVHQKAKRVAAFDIVCLFWALLFASIFALAASTRSGLAVLVAAPGIVCSLSALRLGRSPTLCGNIACFAGWSALTLVALVSGGASAPPLFWYTTLPFLAIHTAGVASGVAWTAIPLVSIAALAAAEAAGVRFPQDVPVAQQKTLYFLVLSCLVICHFVFAWLRVGSEQRARLALREANRRLAAAREVRKTLELGFGLSIEEWEKTKREKLVLERLLAQRTEDADESDEWDLDDDELDRLDALSDSDPGLAVNRPGG